MQHIEYSMLRDDYSPEDHKVYTLHFIRTLIIRIIRPLDFITFVSDWLPQRA